MLRLFYEELTKISETRGWRTMSSEERQRLLRYRRPDGAFSLMFAALLDARGIAGE
jgi:hypothetical protein